MWGSKSSRRYFSCLQRREIGSNITVPGISFLPWLVRLGSYQRFSCGGEKWKRGCQIGRKQTSNTLVRNYQMYCSISLGSQICVELILEMQQPKRLSKMPSNILPKLYKYSPCDAQCSSQLSPSSQIIFCSFTLII